MALGLPIAVLIGGARRPATRLYDAPVRPDLFTAAPAPPESIEVPRPAATVVLVRPHPGGLEVLLTQRPSTMAFGPSLHVFPGGAIDPGDASAAATTRSRRTPAEAADAFGGDMAPDAALSAHVAAIRELWEEAGVLLAEPRGRPADAATIDAARRWLLAGQATIGELADDLDLELRTDLLWPFSRWVTPPFAGRRFDVRFFVAELPPDAEPSFVGEEVVAHRWTSPRAALDARAAGEIALWVPTSATLQQLEHAVSVGEVAERLAPGPSAPIRLEDAEPGIARIVMPGAGGIAGQPVNAWVVGRRALVVVDPGDPSEAAADAVLALAASRSASIAAIAITHAEPDHAAGAEALAIRLSVPLFGGPGAGHDLPAEVIELADGDPVPAGDMRLLTLTTPGPRSDHVAFVADDAGVALVGDLLGPGPARSILGPPDVTAWLTSLDRGQALAARRLLPGHGDIGADPATAIETQRRRLPSS